jgi:hypothetical protein
LSYAEGKYAFGFCDLTGFRYPKKDLVPQIVNQRPTGLLVGRAQAESRQMFAFNPVGGGITELGSRTVGLDIEAQVGHVTVVT